MRLSAGRLQALAAAVLFSTGGAAIKTPPFTALQLSGLRSGIAALALLLWTGGRIRLTRPVVAGAVAYAATVTLFVAATRLTTAANAIFLQSSAPLFLIVLAPSLLREPFRRRDLLVMLVLAGGMALAFAGSPHASSTAPDPPTGNLLGLISSLTWALTLVSLRYLERDAAHRGDGLSVVILGNLLAALFAVPAFGTWPSAGMVGWFTVVYLGVAQIALAYVCLTAAVRRLRALDVSLLLLLEPILNPVWTWLVHGEQPGAAVVAGGAVILVATAIRVAHEASEAGGAG
jgi:drug/metabolite transporter (DMT)-like permease